ncbi:MAG: hypothetical protein R3B46_02025 [Phycisphaerales bacterium]|nr:hypothetical protein [Phycisphaerales bacterium]
MIVRVSHRRGVALLLALLALSVVAAASISMLRTGTDASLGSRARAQSVECDLIIESITPHLLGWLSLDADDAAREGEPLPALGPGLNRVMDQQHGGVRVTVDAIDLSGCLHIRYIDSFAAGGLSELLRSLGSRELQPSTTNRRADDISPPVLPETIAGLASARAVSIDDHVDAFPSRVTADESLQASDACVVMQLTTLGDRALNVRTAPMPILEAALIGRDPAIAGQILDLRHSGRPIPDQLIIRLAMSNEPGSREGIRVQDRTGKNSGSEGNRGGRYVPLTGASSAAGFIVTIRHKGAMRRWWVSCERAHESWAVRESRRID